MTDAIRSDVLDYYIGLGIAVDLLARISVERPDLVLSLENGRLGVGYKGAAASVFAGTASVQPTVCNWQELSSLVAHLPQVK